MGTLENTIRNGILSISQKGTYGTSGFMSEKEAEEVLKLTSSLKKHTGTILGILDGKYVCVPEESRLNKNIAVYGAGGSMKTRVLYQPHSSGCRTGGIIDYLRSEILIIRNHQPIFAGTRIYCPLFLPGISGTLGFLGLPFGNQRR